MTPIPMTGGAYLADAEGRIYTRSWKRTGRVTEMRCFFTKHGYLMTQVRIGGKSSTQLVHRLVADALIPNPGNLPCINHLDGNKANNCVGNLEWTTHSGNIQHAHRTGLKKPLRGSKHGRAKLTDADVAAIRAEWPQKKYGMLTRLAKKYGVGPTAILNVGTRKSWA